MSSTAAAHAVWLSAPLQALVVSTCIAIAAALTDRQLRFELKITVHRFGPHRARFSVQQHPK